MNSNLKVLIFVLIMGMITSGLILGMDVLTYDRIQENELAETKSTILDAYGVSYTFSNIHDVFEENVETVEVGYEGESYTFYIDKTTQAISYEFLGNGLWGPISGIITLNSTFDTIERITVLVQQETPGLGGIVAERSFLDQFPGVKMIPELLIVKDSSPNQDNEVDSITGATGTSTAFMNLLNASYQAHKNAWDNR
ncbi:MAG: FMN-binding protein [Acholeplasmataceae bacterium]|nr:FMN-binding protein [Acholeplasmataceae bacterium]